MTKYELNQLDVRNDGRVILYQRPRNDGSIIPTWQMRISVPNSTGYHRQSTGEKEQPEAIRKALNKYEELAIKVLSGGSLQSKSFKDVYQQWKIDFPKLCIGKDVSETYVTERLNAVGRYPLTYFGDRKIEDIQKKDFTSYRIWRNENSTKLNPSTQKATPYVPSNNTLRKESVCIKQMFEYAVDQGWCSGIPAMDVPSLDKKRRPTFTLNEWRTLYTKMRKWVDEGSKGGLGHVSRSRYLLQQYVLLSANCGARVGELRNLRWNDLSTTTVDDGTDRLVANVVGKTGERQTVFNKGAEQYVKNIYDMRKRELNADPPFDGFVICKKDGSPIGSFKKGFSSLLQYCDLEFTSKGERRTIYSLRHFYATQRLSEEVSPYLLSKNMGTSVEILERHYGQVVNDLVAKEITKSKWHSNPPKVGANEYPFEARR